MNEYKIIALRQANYCWVWAFDVDGMTIQSYGPNVVGYASESLAMEGCREFIAKYIEAKRLDNKEAKQEGKA